MLDTLVKLKNPSVVCHSHADVDAVCSGLVIANRLNCSLIIPDFMTYKTKKIVEKLIPSKYRRIEIGKKPSGDLVVVDANSPEMTGGITNCKVLIDHHIHPRIKAEYSFVFPNYSSTCEIVSRHLILTDWEKPVLAAGMIDDTNILRSVSPHTLQMLTLMISYEQYNRIIALLTEHYSSASERVQVIRSMKNSEIEVVNEKTLLTVKSNSFDPNIADRLNDLVDVVVFYTEKKEGVSVMLRTTDVEFHAGELLQKFRVYNCSAGGHKHAASMKCPLLGEDIIRNVKSEIRNLLKKEE
ncbi:DHH family phosphoesterase [Candidatus Micrarchaeota archaeon]|nr:DHH family phosphoesterase [Candidatus Micrarchaeota archaeon]